jgi:hypothetical protein
MRDDIITAVKDKVFDIVVVNLFEDSFERLQELFLEFKRSKLIFLQEFDRKLLQRVNSEKTDFSRRVDSNIADVLSHNVPDLRPNEIDSINIEMSDFNELL